MIGKNQIVIDASEFLKGLSSGANITDGGFSPDTDHVNLIKSPGVLYAPALAADADTDDRLSTTITIIASCPDMATAMSDNRLLVGTNASQDGTFFRYNGTKIIAATYATDTTRNYAKGITDIITAYGNAYGTSFSHVFRWQNDNTITQDFYAFATATVPHPAVNFENNAYFGDANLLKRMTDQADNTPDTILTLDANSVIMALGTDPGTGYMLISTTSTFNASNTGTGIHKVLWYDGYSSKVIKSVIVEDLVTAFHVHEGVVYVGYGQRIGYLTGGGIKFLRKLANVGLDSNELPWKHNFASIANTLYVLDDFKVLAFGEIVPGKKTFYYCYRNFIGGSPITTTFTFLANGGSNKLLFGITGSFYSFDVTSTASTSTMSFETLRYAFPRPVYLRSVYLEYADQFNTGSNKFLLYKTQAQAEYAHMVAEHGTGTNLMMGAAGYEISVIGFDDNKVRWIQLKYTTDTSNFGLRRIILYYDPAE